MNFCVNIWCGIDPIGKDQYWVSLENMPVYIATAVNYTRKNVLTLATGGSAATRTKTQCLTDFFSVTGQGSGAPPIICGTNTNQHSQFFQSLKPV